MAERNEYKIKATVVIIKSEKYGLIMHWCFERFDRGGPGFTELNQSFRNNSDS